MNLSFGSDTTSTEFLVKFAFVHMHIFSMIWTFHLKFNFLKYFRGTKKGENAVLWNMFVFCITVCVIAWPEVCAWNRDCNRWHNLRGVLANDPIFIFPEKNLKILCKQISNVPSNKICVLNFLFYAYFKMIKSNKSLWMSMIRIAIGQWCQHVGSVSELPSHVMISNTVTFCFMPWPNITPITYIRTSVITNQQILFEYFFDNLHICSNHYAYALQLP